ncbi:uncharacterized protein LOC106157213 [Lingula anatina]|uniref:Uncharacterized protein LOC106157213 n=1 Tax=Lingula anatina TaxID=7574 RepID=A0A2R2MS75_LINAN|nr:uncharacterized protein LOC106157213 [Lingula anatina]|eukprot:XP_023933116.1 uncharacterized protein LOC106157213 [Lingula anatina]
MKVILLLSIVLSTGLAKKAHKRLGGDKYDAVAPYVEHDRYTEGLDRRVLAALPALVISSYAKLKAECAAGVALNKGIGLLCACNLVSTKVIST